MRYTSIAKKFNSHGIRVIGFDQRGHGKSLALGVEKGLAVKGHVGNINEALNDIEALLQIDKTEPVPKFLMGHSMGGLFVIAYALRSTNDTTCPLNGIIASGTFQNIIVFLLIDSDSACLGRWDTSSKT